MREVVRSAKAAGRDRVVLADPPVLPGLQLAQETTCAAPASLVVSLPVSLRV